MRNWLKSMDTKRVGEQTRLSCIYSGAIHGVIAWTIYAIVECWFSTILPWIIKPNYDYVPLHWGFTVLLFFLYPLIGLIIGGLYGLVFHIAEGRISFLQRINTTILFQMAATFTVVLAFDINLIANYSNSFHDSLGLPEFPSLIISLLLTFGLVLSVKSSIWFGWLRFFTNPWTASILLLGLHWINQDLFMSHSIVIKALGVLVYTVVITLISFFVQKF